MNTGCTIVFEINGRIQPCGRPVDDGSDVCYDCRGEELRDE